MSNNVIKFEWDATESAPEHYPMKIIEGTFIYKGETERGLYIPSGGTLVDGWGDPVSSHVTGDKYKPLPDRLAITFFLMQKINSIKVNSSCHMIKFSIYLKKA